MEQIAKTSFISSYSVLYKDGSCNQETKHLIMLLGCKLNWAMVFLNRLIQQNQLRITMTKIQMDGRIRPNFTSHQCWFWKYNPRFLVHLETETWMAFRSSGLVLPHLMFSFPVKFNFHHEKPGYKTHKDDVF